ncbi:MAG: PLP-dependent aminotransferase family protein [Desulfobacterales bacterium]
MKSLKKLASLPLYQSIAGEIRSRISAGEYRPGEKIPSVRKMAEEFGCSKLTVQKAYEKLKKDGFLENIVGSGSFVRFPEHMGDSGDIFDFKTDYISESFFPHETAGAIFSEMFDREKAGVFSQPPVKGDPELLRILSEYYQIPTQRMFIISGAQQGLDLTAKVFSTRISESILFEDPTYPGAISLFKARHFVPLEPDGPDLRVLEQKLSGQIRLFYTMPSVHNPAGISCCPEKKQAIARMARNCPLYIIEDDYLSDFMAHPVPRFADICPERTIYVKSLSQTTVSGLRLGFMTVPEDLYDRFLYAKYTSDIASAGLMQKFARIFIQSGEYRNYIQQTAERIRERKQRILHLIRACPALNAYPGQSGCNIWVRSEKDMTLPHVPWRRGEEFSFSPEFRKYFRISFMNMDDSAFENALTYLGELFARTMA